MKLAPAALLSVLSIAAPIAQAQTTAMSFEGIHAGVNLTFGNATVSANSAAGVGLGSNSDSAQAIGLQIGRGLPFGSNGIANFGVSLGVGDLKSGVVNGQQFKQTQNVGLYGELGYVIQPKSMVYGKLSFNNMIGDLSGDGTVNFNGLGYGAGYRQIVSPSIYVQGEIMQTNFAESTSPAGLKLKPSSTGISLGVGYKF